MERWEDGHRWGGGGTSAAAAQRGKYDTVSAGRDSARTVITTAEKKHGKFGREAAHHQPMGKYEIIILLQNASSLHISHLDSTSRRVPWNSFEREAFERNAGSARSGTQA